MRKLATVLISLVLALLAAEGMVRLLHAAPEVRLLQAGRFRLSGNPRIGFEPAPGAVRWNPIPSHYSYEGEANSLGFRDVEHRVAKPPGVYRIVVLGDSVGAGLGVDRYADTFPPLLERWLAEWHIDAEVINLSVTGYNTQQEVEMLVEKGLRFSPDLVLVAYTLSDRERLDGNIMETLLSEARLGPSHAVEHGNPVLMKSALYRFVHFRVLGAEHPARGADAGSYRRALDAISGDSVDRYFGVLQGLSRRRGFDVLVAAFPYFVGLGPGYRYRADHEFVRAEAARYGFRFLDLLRPMQECRRRSGRINVDSFHPNAAGHRCAAEALAREILRTPPPSSRSRLAAG